VDWTLIRWRAGVVIRVVLGGLWIWASWAKLGDPHQFLRAVRAYDATPQWLTKGIGYGLPLVEICAGVLLILGLITRIAAIVSSFLLVVFLIGIVQAWARGLSNGCGCFSGGGLTRSPHYPLSVLLVLGMLVLAVYLIVWPLSAASIDGRAAQAHEVPEFSAKQMRTVRGQERYQALVAKRQRAARNETLFLSGSLVLIVALISIVGMGVQAQRANLNLSTTATNATVANGVPYGNATAPVVVDLYEDFSCTECAAFEQLAGTELSTLVTAGKIKIRFRPMAYLDGDANGYSSKAANAAICASDVSADAYAAYHSVLFGKDSANKEVQPASGSSGLTDDQLITYGTQAQITASTFTTCVQADTHKDLVQAITDKASDDGIRSTPAVLVDGSRIPFSSAADLHTKLMAQIDKSVAAATAAGKSIAPYTPAPTASATDSDGSTDGATDAGTDAVAPAASTS
jgi:protein-disulfide isomerase